MRKLIYIFISILTLSVMGGCEAVDMDDVEPAGMSLVDEVFFNVVTPFNRAVELADFYFRFMEAHNDNDFVNTLKLEYFGETVPFDEYENESVEVEWWGSVEPAESDETYIVTLDSHWMGLRPRYTIMVTAPRTYHIEYDSEKNNLLSAGRGYELSLEADVHIEERYACADMFRFLYVDLSDGLEVGVRAGGEDEMVRFNMCREGEFVNYPVSGVLYCAVSGGDLNNFRIVFYGDYFEVIEAETISDNLSSSRGVRDLPSNVL